MIYQRRNDGSCTEIIEDYSEWMIKTAHNRKLVLKAMPYNIFNTGNLFGTEKSWS